MYSAEDTVGFWHFCLLVLYLLLGWAEVGDVVIFRHPYLGMRFWFLGWGGVHCLGEGCLGKYIYMIPSLFSTEITKIASNMQEWMTDVPLESCIPCFLCWINPISFHNS